MRLIDADMLIDHVWRDRLDSRELIAEMIQNAPTKSLLDPCDCIEVGVSLIKIRQSVNQDTLNHIVPFLRNIEDVLLKYTVLSEVEKCKCWKTSN